MPSPRDHALARELRALHVAQRCPAEGRVHLLVRVQELVLQTTRTSGTRGAARADVDRRLRTRAQGRVEVVRGRRAHVQGRGRAGLLERVVAQPVVADPDQRRQLDVVDGVEVPARLAIGREALAVVAAVHRRRHRDQHLTLLLVLSVKPPPTIAFTYHGPCWYLP